MKSRTDCLDLKVPNGRCFDSNASCITGYVTARVSRLGVNKHDAAPTGRDVT